MTEYLTLEFHYGTRMEMWVVGDKANKVDEEYEEKKKILKKDGKKKKE